MPSAAAQSIRPPAIRLSYGVPQLIALKATTGRTVPSKFPDARTGAMEQVAFEMFDGAPLYLSFEDAGELEHQLIALGIRAGQDFRLTKIKMPHGGGSAIRVERASDPQPSRGSRPEPPARREYRPAVAASDAEIERKLEASVQLARRDPETAREAFREAAAPAPAARPVEAHVAGIVGAYKSAIDVLIAAQAYARGLGLPLDIHCEDVRCLAATLIINAEGRR